MKKITSFIAGKISCRSWRHATAWLFLFLAGSELGRIMTYTYLAQTAPSISAWEQAAPFVSAVLSAGFLLSAASAFLNRKSFIALGLIFASAGLFSAFARVTLKLPLLFESETGLLIWIYELLVLVAQAGLIITLIKLSNFFKKMNFVLSAEKISSASDRPTFTIL